MKKFLALLLVLCVCISVLTACGGDETFNRGDTVAQTGESDTDASESTSTENGGEDADEAGAEQTFGGLKELKPLN